MNNSNERKVPKLMQGNEACVEGALAAGLGFYAGYPITPSTEIAELISKRLPQNGGVFIQMEDEIASMAAVIGASLVGKKAMTATSGPGFTLKQENIGFAIMTEIPCVVVNVQRVGPSTGAPTLTSHGDVMQARWGSHGDHESIVLIPSSVKEVFELTVTAFNYAERFRTPVILLMEESIGHLRESVALPSTDEINIINRKKPSDPPENYLPYLPDKRGVPTLASFGQGYRYHVTGLVHDSTGFPAAGNNAEIDHLIRRLQRKILDYINEITIFDQFMAEDADLLIIAYGSAARSAAGAVKIARKEGKKVGLLKLKSLWPFPDDLIMEMSKGKRKLLVPELNLGQISREIKRAINGQVEVLSLTQVDGDLITPEKIIAYIRSEQPYAQAF